MLFFLFDAMNCWGWIRAVNSFGKLHLPMAIVSWECHSWGLANHGDILVFLQKYVEDFFEPSKLWLANYTFDECISWLSFVTKIQNTTFWFFFLQRHIEDMFQPINISFCRPVSRSTSLYCEFNLYRYKIMEKNYI